MALTKVTGGTLSPTANYVINNITGAAATFTSLDCSNIDLSTTIFGKKIDLPLYWAPTALQRLFHYDGERAVGKAAKKFNPNKNTSFHTYLHTAMINTIRTFISQAQKKIHPTSMDKLIMYSESEYVPFKISKALEDIRASAFIDEIEIFDILDNLKLTEKEKKYIELRFEDLTMVEISEDLEESAYRVRNKIRKKFENLYKEKIEHAS